MHHLKRDTPLTEVQTLNTTYKTKKGEYRRIESTTDGKIIFCKTENKEVIKYLTSIDFKDKITDDTP